MSEVHKQFGCSWCILCGMSLNEQYLHRVALSYLVGSFPPQKNAHLPKRGLVYCLHMQKIFSSRTWSAFTRETPNDKALSSILIPIEPTIHLHNCETNKYAWFIPMSNGKDFLKICRSRYKPLWSKGIEVFLWLSTDLALWHLNFCMLLVQHQVSQFWLASWLSFSKYTH